MGTSGSETPGTTGGSSTVVLQVRHMPKHRHKVDPHYHTQSSHDHRFTLPSTDKDGGYNSGANFSIYNSRVYGRPTVTTTSAGGENTGSAEPYTDYQGSGEAFSITPPFYKVHIWERLT